MLPRLAIFDMDGLIFDSERLFSSELAKTMNGYGYTLTDENYIRTLGRSLDDARMLMKEMYGDDYPFDEISALTRERVSKMTPQIKPGIIGLLDFFRGNDVKCCVASSTARRYVLKNLTDSGLNEYFSFVIGGEEVGRSKPEPDIFLAALKHDGDQISPAEALVLEDSESGVRAAINAGIPVICIPDMKELPKELLPKTLFTAKSAFEVRTFFRD